MTEVSTIGVVGCGYVGLVTAACLAHLGHRVVCVDKDEGRVRELKADQGEPRTGVCEGLQKTLSWFAGHLDHREGVLRALEREV